MSLRIVFMGTPEFAVPILKNLGANFEIAGVITQPDRKVGRGRVVSPPPVKILAKELNLPVYQPRKLSNQESIKILKDWEPELIVVSAYGQILKSAVLELPIFGCLNVHASLLPRWRGASPISSAILHGDKRTGVTIMKMDPGMDTGPILDMESIDISDFDTQKSLSDKLSALGADLIIRTINSYTTGLITPIAQDNDLATYTKLLKKTDGKMDFNLNGIQLERQVRAYDLWPGTYTYLRGKRLKIYKITFVSFSEELDLSIEPPGTKFLYSGLPAIYCNDGILILDKLQLAGKKIVSGREFIQGLRNWTSE